MKKNILFSILLTIASAFGEVVQKTIWNRPSTQTDVIKKMTQRKTSATKMHSNKTSLNDFELIGKVYDLRPNDENKGTSTPVEATFYEQIVEEQELKTEHWQMTTRRTTSRYVHSP
jgi:hypothetical protein